MDRNGLVEEWFASAMALQRVWKGRFNTELRQERISMGQMALLFYVEANQPVSSKQIGAEHQLSKSAVAQLIDGLETAGLISRQQDPDDRRVAYFSLTPRGKQKVRSLETRRKDFFRWVAGALDDDELRLLAQAQRKMLRQIETERSAGKGDGE